MSRVNGHLAAVTRSLRATGLQISMGHADAVSIGQATALTPLDAAGLVALPALQRISDPPAMAQCDECGDVVPWVEATFLPYATLCGAEDCEIRARRTFDGLPADS